jgi:hypothetical protein
MSNTDHKINVKEKSIIKGMKTGQINGIGKEYKRKEGKRYGYKIDK